MKDRVKKIRLDNDLSQEAFGKRIGLSKRGYQEIEYGNNGPSEGTIRAICSEFSVNRTWLETGEGEMYSISATDAVIEMLMVGESDFAKDVFKRYFNFRSTLSSEEKEILDKACHLLLGIKKEDE